jgi:hypothetical protein
MIGSRSLVFGDVAARVLFHPITFTRAFILLPLHICYFPLLLFSMVEALSTSRRLELMMSKVTRGKRESICVDATPMDDFEASD